MIDIEQPTKQEMLDLMHEKVELILTMRAVIENNKKIEKMLDDLIEKLK